MHMSKMYIHTMREIPAEAEVASHRLLLRAGMIKKLAAGVYGFMPFGKKVLSKIENIVREEMDATGAQEILMSAIEPADLWMESGRWSDYGPELWRIKDRNGRDFCLGPTHEEMFTDAVRSVVSSYRQLPFNLYQIQTKYRDEARPRFGLIRSREFIMKDAYSFDRDDAGLDVSYRAMYDAYFKIFKRCGLRFRPVEADTGVIGGSNSHEFTALCEVGESEILYCESCDMAATTEKAAFADEEAPFEEALPLEKKFTPGRKTIEAVSEFLGISPKKMIKTMCFKIEETDKEPYFAAAFIRGDRRLNKTKLINALGVPGYAVSLAEKEDLRKHTGAVEGFTGPVGLVGCKIIVDSELVNAPNMCAGACEKDQHYMNVNYGRDYMGDIVTDLKLLREGDPCPKCGNPVKFARGIEVGQVFKLGTKYSESMHAVYKDENMVEHPIVMGCYGIGVTRTMAAVVEQNHDEDGIIWPLSVAPYHVMIVLINPKNGKASALAEEIEARLEAAGAEVCLDDRDERPGVKFKDADLIGFPIRITVGRRAEEGIVEYRLRRDGRTEEISAEDSVKKALDLIEAEKRG